MDITFNEVDSIVRTLPIGLYAKRRVPCELDAEAETSYYNPAEDTIVISYPIIADSLTPIKESEEYTKETAVRSMVYHEVSHAILTPKGLINPYIGERKRNVLNIFEDERIETLLRNFYLDVDFKKQVYYINGGIKEPTNALETFYNLVRFGIDFHGLLPRVKEIINNYSNLSVINNENMSDYIWNIYDLYEAVENYFKSDEKNNNPMPLPDLSGMGIPSDINPSFTATMENSQENEEGEVNREVTISTPNINIGDIIKTDNFRDKNIYDTLTAIINQFNFRNNSGNGINSYSGILSPRNFVRDDYRYFDKKVDTNGNNKFGTLHLNLMLDNSGSYCSNCDATNKIIQALIDIEKANKNFTFDVYFVAEYYVKAKNNTEKYINARGGNELRKELFDIVRNAQKPNTYNYNIVMYDGIAYCDYREAKNFGAYNRNNLTIISDSSNKSKIEQYCPNANKIYVDKGYPEQISKIVVETLTKAFR